MMRYLLNNLPLIVAFYSLFFTQVNGQPLDSTDAKGRIKLNIYLENATDQDTLIVSVSNILGTMFPQFSNQGISQVKNERGYFEFDIPVKDSCGYFQVFKSRKIKTESFPFSTESVIKPQFWESGDSLTMKISFEENPIKSGELKKCTFEGNGMLKYQLAMKFDFENFKLEQIHDEKKRSFPPVNWNGNILNFASFDSIGMKQSVMLDALKQYDGKISSLSYNIIKSYILYPYIQYGLVETFIRTVEFNRLDYNSKTSFIDRMSRSYDFPKFHNISKSAQDESIYIMAFLMNRFSTLSYLHNPEYSLDWIYNEIKNEPNISQRTKEILIMRFLLMPFRNAESPSSIYDDARQFIQNPEYIRLLKLTSAKLAGQKFYSFKLPDNKGNMISLADFSGKVVFIDFWYTGCGACANFYKNTLSKVKEAFRKNADVTFVSINVDRTKNTWLSSIDKEIYTSKYLVNLYTNEKGSDHQLLKEYNNSAYPLAILLDKDGRIRYFNTKELYNKQSLSKLIEGLL